MPYINRICPCGCKCIFSYKSDNSEYFEYKYIPLSITDVDDTISKTVKAENPMKGRATKPLFFKKRRQLRGQKRRYCERV